jgi:hypothetical protein
MIATLVWLALVIAPAVVFAPTAYAGAGEAVAAPTSGVAGLAGRATAQPAAWHDSGRLFGTVPVARTTQEIRAMRNTHRPHPPSDPVLACYLTDHIATRCPQTERP